jgi:hypothetical protein
LTRILARWVARPPTKAAEGGILGSAKGAAIAINEYEDKQKLVGAVVLRFANVEAMANALIRFQYVPDVEKGGEFLLDVLADEGFSFGLRCNVLRKILARNGRTHKEAEADVQLLRRLGNARNLLAHIGKAGIVGDKAGYLHPKTPGEVINDDDMEKAFQRFEADCKAAEEFPLDWLVKLSPTSERSGAKLKAAPGLRLDP